MARFGQGLIQSLINPSYADQLSTVGMMAGSLGSRRRQEEEEKAKLEQQRAAQASLFSILNQANPNDPNTANAVTQMGVAYGLDPAKTQEALLKAQTSARNQEGLELRRQTAEREQERLEMARTDAKYRAADQAWQEEQRQIQQTQSRVAQAVEGVLASNPEKLESVIFQVPEEHREFARKHAASIQEYQAGVEERREKALAKQELTNSELEMYEGLLGKEAVDAYRVQSKTSAVRARERLEGLYNDALKAQITARDVQEAEANKPPQAAEVTRVKTLIDKELSGSGFLWWKDPAILTEGEREQFAYAAASKMRTDPEWIPNKENLEAYWNELNNKEVAPQTDQAVSEGGSVSFDDMTEEELLEYIRQQEEEQ